MGGEVVVPRDEEAPDAPFPAGGEVRVEELLDEAGLLLEHSPVGQQVPAVDEELRPDVDGEFKRPLVPPPAPVEVRDVDEGAHGD